MCVHACRSSFFTLLRTDERTTRGVPIPSPLPVTFFFPFFFFLFAMLMRDELACIVFRRRCRRRPSVRPSVSPRHEAGSFSRHLHTHSRRRIKWPTRPVVVRGHIRCRTNIYAKKKEIWVSLSRRAQIPHSTRTKVHGSAPLHHSDHTTNLHYTTVQLATTDLLRRERCRMFQIQDVCFSCSAVLLPETYGIPYLLVYISCPLVRRKGRTTPSSPAVSYIPY